MRSAVCLLSAGLIAAGLSIPAIAATDEPAAPAPITCGNGVPGGINCLPSKKDQKEARKAYSLGLKLQKQNRFHEAFEQLDRAARLDPRNPRIFQTRELAKAGLVYEHVERGNQLVFGNESAVAAKEFQAALDLDPENQFARQRLEGILPAPRQNFLNMAALAGESQEIHLQPTKDRASFQFRGDVRGLFGQLA